MECSDTSGYGDECAMETLGERHAMHDNSDKGRECGLSAGPRIVAEPSGEDVLSPDDVADYLHVSRSMAYKMLGRKEFKSFKVGTLVRIRREDLMEALLSGRNNS